MSRSLCIAWLQLACFLTMAFGLAAVSAAHPAGEGPWMLLMEVLTSPSDSPAAGLERQLRVLNAVVGGVMIGWGALLAWLVSGPLRAGDRTTATAMLVSVCAWFIPDSLGSLAAGVPRNVVLNVIFFLLFSIPLARLRAMPV